MLLLALPAAGAARPYFIGARGELATLTGGHAPHFYVRGAYGLEAGLDLSPRWSLEASLSRYDLYNDTTIAGSVTLNGDREAATARFSGTRLGVDAVATLFAPASWLSVRGGPGGGLLIWKMRDPDGDTVLKAVGGRGETIDFASTEIFVSGRLGIEVQLAAHLSTAITAHVDYLTGAGTDFADAVNARRDRWLGGVGASLRLTFGGERKAWASHEPWSAAAAPAPPRDLDSDGDGIPDREDRCAGTPAKVAVDPYGCPLDTDGDGVVDSEDDCPGTEARARGRVDIHGCAVDADFDGVADFLDECPGNRVGAEVDRRGCPVDDDGDGVPNGLDDCPHTLYGVPVDKFGCLDLALFDEPMVLNIDYPSGSFEIDPSSQERLRSLARALLVAPNVRLEINGYTDNIGTDEANRSLSEKRANRVRDFLAAQGVAESRMSVNGRGETGFVASNETAEGRALNRRIEIVFYK